MLMLFCVGYAYQTKPYLYVWLFGYLYMRRMSNLYAYILLCQETRLADLAKRYESQLKKITTELKSKAKELDAAR